MPLLNAFVCVSGYHHAFQQHPVLLYGCNKLSYEILEEVQLMPSL